MGVSLNPYLHFDGQAAEALAFYGAALGGTSSSTTYSEFGVEGPDADRIMHGQLDTDHGLTLMVADMPPGSAPVERGNAMTVALSGVDVPRLHELWARLSEGGVIDMPMEKQTWGDEFGVCRDRFGVAWLVNITMPSQ